MIDFREYVEVEPYIHFKSDNTSDEFVDEFEEDNFDDLNSYEYFESPFTPVEIGDYVLSLYASQQNFCTPAMNSYDKYFFQQWELCIEKVHDKYGYVVCTAEVMNELGFDSFKPMDYYIAYADIELTQRIFDHLLNKLKLPQI